jgi:hypothetical protein
MDFRGAYGCTSGPSGAIFQRRVRFVGGWGGRACPGVVRNERKEPGDAVAK